MTLYSFDGYELDERTRELRQGGSALPIQPKAFDVLVYLVRQRDRVVTKHELLDTLWPDEIVTDSSLSFCISRIRKLLDDDGAKQRRIKSFRGTGYRFIASLAEAAPPLATTSLSQLGPPEPQPAPPTDDFVGRVPERATFRSHLDEARRSHGQVLLLSGEAGIGKTRFLAEMAPMARAAGFRVMRGVCHDPEGSVPYWPWVEVLRTLLENEPEAAVRELVTPVAADLVSLLPSLRHLVPEMAPTTAAASPELARVRLFDAFRSVLWRAARDGALLLVLDDLHWADPSSLTLLRHLAAGVDGAPVLLVASYRDTDLVEASTLAATVRDLRRQGHVHSMRLGPLATEEVRALLHRRYWALSLLANVVDICRERTGGNPFFLEALCDHWLQLRDVDPGASVRTLPGSVQDLLRQRLQRLPETERRVLTLAAAIGGQFRVATLEQVALGELSADTILESLDSAVRAGLIGEAGSAPGTYRFAHTLMRELLYGDLSAMRRVRLHRRIGEALEAELDAGATIPPGELAQQFALAAIDGNVDRAVHYLQRAADEARSQFATGDQLRTLQQALGLLDLANDAPPARRLALLLQIAQAHEENGTLGAARVVALEAADLARQIGDGVALARAAIAAVSSRPRMADDPEPPMELLRAAEAALAEDEAALKALLLSRHAVALGQLHAPAEEIRTRLDEALRLARATGDRPTIASVLEEYLLAMAPFLPSEVLQAVAEDLDAIEGNAELTQSWITAQRVRIYGLLEHGQTEAATGVIESYFRRATDAGPLIARWNSTVLRSTSSFLEGDLARAEEESDRAAELGQAFDHEGVIALGCRMLQRVLHRQALGGLEEVEPVLAMFAAMATDTPLWRGLLAECRSLLLPSDAARPTFAEIAANDFATVAQSNPATDLHSWHGGVMALAHACVRLGEVAAAPGLYSRLLPWSGRWAVTYWGVGCSGPVDRALGMLAAQVGDWAKAEAHFAAALADPGLSRTPLLRARVELDYAAALLRQGRKRDVARAEGLRRSGLAALAKGGAHGWLVLYAE